MSKYDYSVIHCWTHRMVGLYLNDMLLDKSSRIRYAKRMLEQHSLGELELTEAAYRRLHRFLERT
jgi:hypothetical protein